LGTLAGSAGARELGRLANEHEPVLPPHDRSGHRIDVVEYHPAYRDLMKGTKISISPELG
jgi:putative acyl-CoA dehydrogenase